MEKVRYQDIEKEEWDSFVEESDETWLYHLSDWISIEEKVFTNLSFAVYQEHPREILGICVLYYSKNRGLTEAATLNTGGGRAGFALKRGLPDKRRKKIMKLINVNIDKLAHQYKVNIVIVRLPTMAPKYLPPERPEINPLTYYGFTNSLAYCARFLHSPPINRIINLKEDEKILWQGMDKGGKSAVNQARKSEVTVKELQKRDELEDYYKMHVETFNYTGASVVPLAFYQEVYDKFYSKGYMRLTFAEHNNKKIAAIITLNYKQNALYWTNVSRIDSRELRPNNLLVWEDIMYYKNKGCGWFEVGSYYPAIPYHTVGNFKKQFGGLEFYYFEGMKVYNENKYALYKLMQLMKENIRRPLSKIKNIIKKNIIKKNIIK